MLNERSLLEEEGITDKDLLLSRLSAIEQEATLQEKDALSLYGMLENSDPGVSPLRRALAVWGLTADDIGVLSIHGTSTVANVSTISHSRNLADHTVQERNETHIWNDILTSMGRSSGNAVPVMAQKCLTGLCIPLHGSICTLT
jgi:fatty acid synthase subunit alpha, fungi type